MPTFEKVGFQHINLAGVVGGHTNISSITSDDIYLSFKFNIPNLIFLSFSPLLNNKINFVPGLVQIRIVNKSRWSPSVYWRILFSLRDGEHGIVKVTAEQS